MEKERRLFFAAEKVRTRTVIVRPEAAAPDGVVF
ncbi:hypothetical protein MPNT_30110 [Candidatus Methylacidithermus pantelleriae]|uniref:Uncharacterized protein n=1 Tax=Candidatus Methylacidithermus pantelleriae TaxID=2744239 RepID=A0A8J2BK63_9BACT|nr:hypothetical protein MPNT_30110 [Candidatus Methylacidithermus pantelleriae]